ncbi:MAG: hypothetical protein WCL07_01160, partial [bacterium]
MNSNTSSTLTQLSKHLLTLQLSPISRKIYLADAKRFLLWLETQDQLILPSTLTNPRYYQTYLKLSKSQGFTPSLLKRTLASLHQLGSALSKFYQCDSPTIGLNLDANLVQIPATTLSDKYIKWFTNSLKEAHLSPLTIKSYKSDIEQYMAWVGTTGLSTQLASLINDKTFAKYSIYLSNSNTISPTTITRKQQSYARFVAWASSNTPNIAPADNTNFATPASISTPVATRASFRQAFGHVFTPTSIISGAVLLALSAGLVFFGYRQLQKDRVLLTQAYPGTPVTPNRQLSFQGRLENAGGTPVNTSKNLVFKLWDDSSVGTELYSTGICAITPDGDGIFSTQIGSTCGSAIGSNVFTENPNVYLEVTVETEVMAPRQPIATVAYALNSETIQGIPLSATMSAITNTIVPMNKFGEIVIGEQSPKMVGVSGTFNISAPALSFTTGVGTNGNISLAPDGTGQINVTGNTLTTNFFNISNAQLTTGSLMTGTVGNDNTGFKFLDFQGGSSPISKFSVASTGAVTSSGTSNLAGLTINSAYTFPTIDGTSGYVLATNGTGTVGWAAQTGGGGGGDSYWGLNNGALAPVNDTLDVLIGSSATSSAKFGFLNLSSGTPTLAMANQASNITIKNNTSNALQILEASNPYFDITTTTGSEKMTFGNGVTNPDYSFIGSGSVNFAALTASRAIFTDPSNLLTNSAPSTVLLNSITDETGTGTLVFNDAPTFATNATIPHLLGGSAISSSLLLQSTSGIGTTDYISLLVGNNGATEALRAINNGNIGIGDTTPAALFTVGNGDLFQVNSTGAIAAATGITSSGNITFSSLAANRFVGTTTGGLLTTTLASSDLSSSLSDETGTGVAVFNDSPSFTTKITSPMMVGGSTASSNLLLRSTSGVGTSDYIAMQVGNSGATEALRAISNGNVGIGGVAAPTAWLDLAAATLGKSQLNLSSSAGINPTSPLNGDFWWNGTNLNFYDGITTDILGQSRLWTDGGTYLFPSDLETLGNSASGTATGKLTGLYLADSSPLAFGNNNNISFSFSGTTLGSTLTSGTKIGIGTTNALATVDIRGSLGTIPVASISGTTSQSVLVIDQSGVGDIFTASNSGATRFVVKNNGFTGINSANPTSSLEIGNATATISNDAGDITIIPASGLLSLSGNNIGNLGNITVSNHAYFAGGSTYYVDDHGNAKFFDLVAADTTNPGLTVGNGSTGFAKIGSATIGDNTTQYLSFDTNSDGIQEFIINDSGSISLKPLTTSPTGTAGSLYYNSTTTTGGATGNVTGDLFMYGQDAAWHRIALDMTQYATSAANVANKSYIEITHNQNTNDISFTGWFKNTLTGLWQSITDLFTHTIKNALDNEFNPEFSQKSKVTAISLKAQDNGYGTGADGAITVSSNASINAT